MAAPLAATAFDGFLLQDTTTVPSAEIVAYDPVNNLVWGTNGSGGVHYTPRSSRLKFGATGFLDFSDPFGGSPSIGSVSSVAIDPLGRGFGVASVIPDTGSLTNIDLSAAVDGDLDGDGDIDSLTTFGTRSASIYDGNGNLVFDTNDLPGFDGFEQWIALNDPAAFNINEDGTSIDNRSDNKGPEPEALVIGEDENGDLYLIVGMERTNHLFLFGLGNSADPFSAANVSFIDAIRLDGQFAPEGLDFLDSSESPNGRPALLVSYEVSGTIVAFNIPEPSTALLLVLSGVGLVARRGGRRRRGELA